MATRSRALIHSSQNTLLYRVLDPKTGKRKLVLKTLQPERDGDLQERSAFAHEEWLARRAVARFFPQVVTPEQRNYLYYLSTWHDGHTLQQHLDAGRHFTIPEAVAEGAQAGARARRAAPAQHHPSRHQAGQCASGGRWRTAGAGPRRRAIGTGSRRAAISAAGGHAVVPGAGAIRQRGAVAPDRCLCRRRHAVPDADASLSVWRDRTLPAAAFRRRRRRRRATGRMCRCGWKTCC